MLHACCKFNQTAMPLTASSRSLLSHIMQAKTVVMQSMVSTPDWTQATPSVLVSQKRARPVCIGAPFFCIIVHVTTYLNGLFSFASSFKQSSIIWLHHAFTLSLLYAELPRVFVIAVL